MLPWGPDALPSSLGSRPREASGSHSPRRLRGPSPFPPVISLWASGSRLGCSHCFLVFNLRVCPSHSSSLTHHERRGAPSQDPGPVPTEPTGQEPTSQRTGHTAQRPAPGDVRRGRKAASQRASAPASTEAPRRSRQPDAGTPRRPPTDGWTKKQDTEPWKSAQPRKGGRLTFVTTWRVSRALRCVRSARRDVARTRDLRKRRAGAGDGRAARGLPETGRGLPLRGGRGRSPRAAGRPRR